MAIYNGGDIHVRRRPSAEARRVSEAWQRWYIPYQQQGITVVFSDNIKAFCQSAEYHHEEQPGKVVDGSIIFVD